MSTVVDDIINQGATHNRCTYIARVRNLYKLVKYSKCKLIVLPINKLPFTSIQSLGLGIIDVDPYFLYMDVDPDPAFIRSLGLKMAHFKEEKKTNRHYTFLFLVFLNNQKIV